MGLIRKPSQTLSNHPPMGCEIPKAQRLAKEQEQSNAFPLHSMMHNIRILEEAFLPIDISHFRRIGAKERMEEHYFFDK